MSVIGWSDLGVKSRKASLRSWHSVGVCELFQSKDNIILHLKLFLQTIFQIKYSAYIDNLA